MYNEFQRMVAYEVGDDHCRRITRLINIYCWLFRMPKSLKTNLMHLRWYNR
jgi:hypothetical protein